MKVRVYRLFCGKQLCSLILAILGFGLILHHPALAADPAVNVVAPSNEFGDVGAALGNVWDMNSVNDVTWKQPDASNRTVQYTLKSAADPTVPPGGSGFVLKGVTPKGSDLVSAFYTNSQVSIPSQIYRYLIYRLYIAPHQPGESGIERTNARILFSSEWGANWQIEAFPFRRYSVPQRLGCPPTTAYGDWCTFFIDLAQPNLTGPGSPHAWNWAQPGAKVEAFGLWPHENWCNSQCNPSGDSPDYFYLDYVFLTGEIIARQPDYQYTIKWNVADSDGGQLNSTLYYQQQDEILSPALAPSCNAGNLSTAWIPIPGGATSTTVSGLPPSPHQIFLPLVINNKEANSFGSGVVGPFNQSFVWHLSDNNQYPISKAYYVCVVVEDSHGNETYQVSSAPIFKVPAPADLVINGLPN